MIGTLQDNYLMNYFEAKIDAQVGTNSLSIKRKNQGCAIGDVSIVRYGLN